MEENKDLMNNSAEEVEIVVEARDEVSAEEFNEVGAKKTGFKAIFNRSGEKKIKNQAFAKRGGISIAVTAIFLALLIVVNILVSTISKRFMLEIDMTTQKINTVSEENVKFIKSIKDEVSVTVFATEENFVDYMEYYSEEYYQATYNSDYFEQTLSLITKYGDYNKNIKIKFIDPQSTEYSAFSSNYPTLEIIPGDIFVESGAMGISRQKKIGFEDIYTMESTDQYGGYSYSGAATYNLTGNNVETALTSAIAYVTSSESKKIGLITGHTVKDWTSNYRELLKDNNYDVEIIEDAVINSIASDLDAIAILAPAIDFTGDELDAISEFLDNNGKLGKGLIYFGDASFPMLPNLSEFLVEWGIELGDGILYETDEQLRSALNPCVMAMSALNTDFTNDMGVFAAGYNVPMLTVEPASEDITVTEYVNTSKTVVVAPVGLSDDWSDYKDSDKSTYVGVAEAKKIDQDADGNEISSSVIAFSSIEFIQSEWAEYAAYSNKNITLKCTEAAAHVSEEKITFVVKTITDENFMDSVSEGSVNAVRTIFMVALPAVMIALGIYIYIRRKNA